MRACKRLHDNMYMYTFTLLQLNGIIVDVDEDQCRWVLVDFTEPFTERNVKLKAKVRT